MPNTSQEDQLAVSAFRVVARKYAAYFNMNPSVESFCQSMMSGQGIGNYVKFMDHVPFMANYNITGAKKIGSACAVCGFTTPKAGNKYDREMYVNRNFANASTLVHEMLHFLTHPNFWMYAPPQITEAVTEYFTRKVIHRAQNQAFDISQRKNRYDAHHQLLTIGRGDIKARKAAPGKHYMKRAYFQGETAALAFVLKEFKTIDELLQADDENQT
jgi:hypothetical protein